MLPPMQDVRCDRNQDHTSPHRWSPIRRVQRDRHLVREGGKDDDEKGITECECIDR